MKMAVIAEKLPRKSGLLSKCALAVVLLSGSLAGGAFLWPRAAQADAACFQTCMTAPNPSGSSVPNDPQKCLQSCGYQPTIDYRCVNTCAAMPNARGTNSCVQQCSFFPADILTIPVPDLATRHNQFSSPIPIDSGQLVNGATSGAPAQTPKNQLAPTVQPLSPSTNYKNLQQCVMAGYLFSYCVSASKY